MKDINDTESLMYSQQSVALETRKYLRSHFALIKLYLDPIVVTTCIAVSNLQALAELNEAAVHKITSDHRTKMSSVCLEIANVSLLWIY